MDFWHKLKKPYFVLAPMEGVTDIVFREVVEKATRPDVFFTEFTNVSSFASEKGRPSAISRLEFTKKEQPIVAQIWGKKPEHFAITAQGVKNMKHKAIDINMGCPDRKVVRSGGGANLIRHPKLAAKIIAATKTADLPVSVKTRIGYSRIDEWRDWLTFLLEQDLSAITVHLRTKKEMSKVPAHFVLIPEILSLRDKLSPQTAIIINGDIKTRVSGEKLAKKFDIDGIMIGRGIFENPFCFEKKSKVHSQDEYLGLLKSHLDIFEKYVQKRTSDPSLKAPKFDPLKRFFKIYVRDFSDSSKIRAKMMRRKSVQEIREILEEL
jgi:tRNA-dihydrouridine synthase